ncbi:MAG: hypothetical protein ACE5K4_05820 [Candidatus Hydrothermarchaeota archaeon]
MDIAYKRITIKDIFDAIWFILVFSAVMAIIIFSLVIIWSILVG